MAHDQDEATDDFDDWDNDDDGDCCTHGVSFSEYCEDCADEDTKVDLDDFEGGDDDDDD